MDSLDRIAVVSLLATAPQIRDVGELTCLRVAKCALERGEESRCRHGQSDFNQRVRAIALPQKLAKFGGILTSGDV